MMRAHGASLAVASVVLSAACSAVWAQGVKLRATPSIYLDSKGAGLLAPEGVACGARVLAVADTGNGRIVLYDLGDRLAVPRVELVVDELKHPVELHFDPKGNLIVFDGKTRKLGRVGSDGVFQGFVTLESRGGGDPVVRSFAVGGDGSLYVLDIAGGRVLVTSAEGKFLRQVLLPAECRAPSGVAVDTQGKIFVADSAEARLYVATKDQEAMAPITGSLREDLDFANALAVDGRGHVLVLDAHGGGIVILSGDGSFRGRQAGFGWLDGQLRWPSSLCVGSDGFVAVADRQNNRIATFRIAP